MASSGDLLADKRFTYAEDAFREGDLVAAADLARQTLDLAPRFAPAWFLLGQAQEACLRDGEGGPDARRDAVAAFETALALDPEDILGAGVRLALVSGADPLKAMSPGYVRQLFDDYAIRFDRQLRTSLRYRGPEILHAAVRRACSLSRRPFRFGTALDLGCGTGLAGETFRPECDRLVGIDLSPGMARKAAAKRIYDEIATGDLVAWLATRAAGEADLVLAADVFVYLGDLAPVFAAARDALGRDGLFAFTVQAHDGEGVVLGSDQRFAHGERYLRDLAEDVGLGIVLAESVSTRQDRGLDVPGLVAVSAR